MSEHPTCGKPAHCALPERHSGRCVFVDDPVVVDDAGAPLADRGEAMWLDQAALDFENQAYRPTAHYVRLFRNAATLIRAQAAALRARDAVQR